MGRGGGGGGVEQEGPALTNILRLDTSTNYPKPIFGMSCHCSFTAYSGNLSEFKASTLRDKTERQYG